MDNVTFSIRLYKDSHGNQWACVYEEGGDRIQICKLKDKEGNPLEYYDDAWHSDDWCRENGIEYKHIQTELHFKTLWKSLDLSDYFKTNI